MCVDVVLWSKATGPAIDIVPLNTRHLLSQNRDGNFIWRAFGRFLRVWISFSTLLRNCRSLIIVVVIAPSIIHSLVDKLHKFSEPNLIYWFLIFASRISTLLFTNLPKMFTFFRCVSYYNSLVPSNPVRRVRFVWFKIVRTTIMLVECSD